MEKLKYKNLDFQLQEVNEEEYTIKGVFSTGDVDRQGEIIDQKGWDLSSFLRNPVVLFAHDHYQPAIGKVISIGLNLQEQLEGVIKFAVEEYDFARTIFQLYKNGYMNAFSAGFINNEIDQRDDGTTILVKNELLEMSAVNVPANALALAKSKGIDTKSLEEFQAKRIKSPACRMDGETKEECVARKIPEIMKENPDMSQDQAIAIAESLCSKKCEDKNNSDSILKSVKSDLEKIKSDIEQLQRSEPGSNTGGKKGKVISIKRLNKVIRSLLKLNYKLKNKVKNEQEKRKRF